MGLATSAARSDAGVGLGKAARRRDALELGLGWGLILLVIWSPKPYQRVLYWAPVLFIAGATWLRFEGWAAMGLRCRNLLRSSWIVGVALLAGAGAWAAARHFGTLHRPDGAWQFFMTYVGYTIWSFVQQFLLLSFFLARFRRLLPGRYGAALAAASIFALAHLPNPVLTPLTLVWGMVSCLVFLRYRNVWTLGMAHAVLGVTVAITIPGTVTHNMRVGLGYLKYRNPSYRPHGRHHRSHSDQMVSTEAWVRAEAATRRC